MKLNFHKGIILEQFKEPALSRELRCFQNNGSSIKMDRLSVQEMGPLKPIDIIEIAEEAGIIDELDNVPLYRKLKNVTGIRYQNIVVNAIDDEPYVSSRLNPMMKLKDLLLSGLLLASHATGIENYHIAIYKNLSDLNMKIPNKLGDVKIKRYRGVYPVERKMKSSLADKKTLFLGVGALIHLHRAIYQNEVQSTCFITVSGNCISNPMNLEVSIGMTVMQILDRCGLSHQPTRVILGGSMTGFEVIDREHTFVSPTSRAILAMRNVEDLTTVKYNCIGCGKCYHVCPQKLPVYYIYRYALSGQYKEIKDFEIERCIECGSCAFICPSKIDIMKYIIEAKQYFSINTY